MAPPVSRSAHIACERRRRRHQIGQLAVDPDVKIIRVVKRIATSLTEGRAAADHGVLREGPGRAGIAPFVMDILGGLGAPE